MNGPESVSLDEAMRVLDVCVAERGAGYIYPDTAKRMGTCDYWWDKDEYPADCDGSSLPEGPGCIVGLALSKLGVSDEFLQGLGGINAKTALSQLAGSGWRIAPDVIGLFRYAQVKQDVGEPWAYAVERAKLNYRTGEDL